MRDDETAPAFLVPTTADELLAHFAELPGHVVADGCVAADGVDVLAVVGDVFGGCVVRTAAMMGDAEEMASMLSDAGEAAAIIAHEEAAADVQEAVARMGGVPAYMTRGRWRPLMDEHRADWAAHLAEANTARMRGVANENRAAWAKAA